MVRSDGSSLSKSDLDALKTSIKGKVLIKGEAEKEEYEAAIGRWNRMYVKEANIIIFAADEDDVSAVIKFVAKHDLDFSITSGRHSYSGPSSTTGLVLDMKNINKIHIDETAKTGRAGGGAIAEDLERAAYAKGLRAVCGAVNETGLGGITTGGGIGYLSSQYGLVCDNLLAARVALADGTIVTASAKENSDLFFGIRGGGSNFGVCTEFTYQLHDDTGDCYLAFIMLPPNKTDDALALANTIATEIVPSSNGKLQPSIMMMKAPGLGYVSSYLVFYDGPEEEAKTLLKPVFDLEPMKVMGGMMPYPEATDIKKWSAMFPKQYNRICASSTQMSYPLDLEVMKFAVDGYKALADKHGEHTSQAKFMFDLRDYRKVAAVPTDATAYVNRTAGCIAIADFFWDDASLDETLMKEIRALTSSIRQKVKAKKGDSTAISLSPEATTMPSGDEIAKNAQATNGTKAVAGADDGEDGEHIASTTLYALISDGKEKLMSVYGSNLPRLRELKRKFDPGCMFDKWYPIEPAPFN